MEYFEGVTLEKLFQSQIELTIQLKTQILAAILSILTYFHTFGFIHRDVKPQNIILTKDGKLILVDMGSVKI